MAGASRPSGASPPYEFICKSWTAETSRFRLNPLHQMPGLNIARREFPDLPGEVVDRAIDAEIKYRIPAQSVPVERAQWDNLMKMQVYLKNIKGTTSFAQIVDNSFSEKAMKAV